MKTINKVLIIDDDARNIFALSAVLKAKGYECLSTQDAPSGIDLMQSDDTIDVVLLDMMMPEMDGYEALKIMKETTGLSHIPVIAVTARAMTEDKLKCMEAGANAYVSKPVDIDLLIKILDGLNI